MGIVKSHDSSRKRFLLMQASARSGIRARAPTFAWRASAVKEESRGHRLSMKREGGRARGSDDLLHSERPADARVEALGLEDHAERGSRERLRGQKLALYLLAKDVRRKRLRVNDLRDE
jgi:hypothetical protein